MLFLAVAILLSRRLHDRRVIELAVAALFLPEAWSRLMRASWEMTAPESGAWWAALSMVGYTLHLGLIALLIVYAARRVAARSPRAFEATPR